MRYVWVGLLIVLLDLLGKLLATHGVYSDGLIIPLGVMQIQVFGGGGDAVLLAKPLAMDIGSGAALLVPLIAVLFLLLLDRPLLMSYTLFGLGVQFLAGSGLAETLTLFLHGEGPPLIAHDPTGQVILLLAARHVALLAGVGMLVADQVVRRNVRSIPPSDLQLVPPVAINLTGLRRGDDNVHIDATLSQVFMRDTRSAAAHLAKQYLDSAGKPNKIQPAVKILQSFRDSYAGMLRVAINQARPTGETSHIDLLRLAVLMYVRDQVRSAIAEETERRYERNRGALQRTNDGSDTRQSAAERLLVGRGTVFHLVCRQLFLPLATQEQNVLQGAGEALQGLSLSALFGVPLLQAATPEDDDVLMEYYTLLGHRRSDAYSFRRLDALFNEVFPPSLGKLPGNGSGIAGVSGSGMAPSLLDVPQNITLLLDVEATKEAMRVAQSQGDRALTAELHARMRFQHIQMAALRLALERADLVTTLLALYETPQLYAHYSGAFAPHLINELVRSRRTRRHIWRRLGMGGSRVSDQPSLQPILQASRRVRSRSRHEISAILLRFAEDFSNYRRDFQLYLATQEAVSKIRLLYAEREIVTARLNRRLYEFPTPDEVAVSAETVAGHVILKADLRGSTQITEQLTRRELNPATFFSRNFYEPITALIENYHGEKIFIEGDAMIMMFLETADPRRERLAVASACALAVRLLEMVARNNERNASYDLPPLETGIGITYQAGSPTYVFDGSTRIVISPAINRADRLSSSVAGLRKYIATHPHAPRVAVFKAANGGDALGDKQTLELIYNVDGVALEPAAFAQLAEELPLRRMLDVPGGLGDGELFATPWPFHADRHSQLVVRRAEVCKLNEALAQASDAPQPCYFEVIADPALLVVLERSRLGEPLSGSSALKSVSLP